MPTFQELLGRTSALHSHLCPRQVLGVRIGMYAGELLGLDLPQTGKRLFTFVETDGCFMDGVSVATNCWPGRRTMRVMDYGKAAATFVDTHTGMALRIWPHPSARQRSLHYVPSAPDRWHAQLEAYQIMPACELLSVEHVTLTVSLEAIISRPGLRVACEQCGEEVMNARQVTVDGHVLCRHCAGMERYYQLLQIENRKAGE